MAFHKICFKSCEELKTEYITGLFSLLLYLRCTSLLPLFGKVMFPITSLTPFARCAAISGIVESVLEYLKTSFAPSLHSNWGKGPRGGSCTELSSDHVNT